MQAKENDEDENSMGTTANPESNLLEKPMTQEELNKKNFKPAYAYFVLFLALVARIMVQWQRKGINYAYSYKGLGD